MSTSLECALGAIWTGTRFIEDFERLCDTGGRLAGSGSESGARDYLSRCFDELGGKRHDFSFDYTGLLPGGSSAALRSGSREWALDTVTLPGSPAADDLSLEVVDLGGGTKIDFDAAANLIPGRAVLVRHEYPFSTGHTHRRLKYEWAKEFGAAAFLISNNNPMGGTVTGGSGTWEAGDIPALGLSYDSGEIVRAACDAGPATLRMSVESEERTWQATNLITEMPGTTDRWVVLCAHIDGHNVAESAMDNATGLATVLEVGRRMSEFFPDLPVGLRLAAFNVEEWGLDGSRRYVEHLSTAERNAIDVAIALDSITGHPRLSALTGGNGAVERFVQRCTASTAVPVDVVRPMLSNSDHYNFQNAQIPAMRLIAGYGREESLTRYLLTPSDRRSMVDPSQLKAAAMTTLCMVYAACSGDGPR